MATSKNVPGKAEFTPVEFVKDGPDGERSMFAHSPAEVVKYQYDGWAEKTAGAAEKSVGAVVAAAEKEAAASAPKASGSKS